MKNGVFELIGDSLERGAIVCTHLACRSAN